MFPIGDDNSDRRITPFVTYILLALNVAVFVLFQQLGGNEAGTLGWAAVPGEILTGYDIITPESVEAAVRQTGETVEQLEADPDAPLATLAGEPRPSAGVYLTLITCMFLHGSIMHLGGNMLYLWIFGDNLEDAMGHVRFLLFYLVTGVLATAAHIIFTLVTGADTLTPLVGASGAISGVLGGYILLYPTRRIRTLILFRMMVEVPAWVAIGLWFALQLFSSFGPGNGGGEGGGVAYMAHIGGFVAGLILVKAFQAGHPKPAAWALPH